MTHCSRCSGFVSFHLALARYQPFNATAACVLGDHFINHKIKAWVQNALVANLNCIAMGCSSVQDG
jgi:hypothetical protein